MKEIFDYQIVPFLLKLFCFSLRKQYRNDNIANFVYYVKMFGDFSYVW